MNGTFTPKDFPSAGENIRKHLQLWQQQMRPPVDQSSPFTTKAINHPHAAYNILQQGVDDVQTIEETIEEDEEIEEIAGFDGNHYLAQPGDVIGLMYVFSGIVQITRC